MTDPLHDKIVFLHIPKTAGQTVHMEMERILGTDVVSPIRIHTQVKTQIEQFPIGYRLYSGHLDWKDISGLPSPRFSFTVLRDPLERIASFYFFLLRKAEIASPEVLASGKGATMRKLLKRDAAAFFFEGNDNWITWLRDHFDNLQANYLATGLIRGRRTIPDLDHETLVDLALDHSRNIDRIYTTSTFQRLEDDLTPYLGVRPNFVSLRVNAAPIDAEAKRWPALAALLGPDAAAIIETYGTADQLLIDRLGLSV